MFGPENAQSLAGVASDGLQTVLNAGSTMEPRTRVIMTYALCGFANVASVGINVAGCSVLAPARRSEIIGKVWKAMMAGFLATCLTASVAGAMPGELLGL